MFSICECLIFCNTDFFFALRASGCFEHKRVGQPIEFFDATDVMLDRWRDVVFFVERDLGFEIGELATCCFVEERLAGPIVRKI